MLKVIWNTIKSVLRKICLFLGGIVLICLIFFAVSIYKRPQTSELPLKTYLEVDLSESYPESSQTSIIDDLMGEENLSFMQLIRGIEFAAADSRITGMVLKVDSVNTDLAQTQNLANTLLKFKASGKKIYVYSRGFGNLGQGNREYYLATFADKIYMQPHGWIGYTGISVEVPFIKKALEKIGVEPEFYSRYEYKNAMAFVTDDKMTPFYEEELKNLAGGIMNELNEAVAKNRNIKNIKELVDNAPFSAEQGVKNKLIDGVMYSDEFENMLKKENFGEKSEMIDYASTIQNNQGNMPTIALLNLEGIINSGEDEADISGEAAIFSETVVEQIKEISKLQNLRALVVRVNSPGGEYGAADEIYYALQSLKKRKNIPVVISQGGYAASGGYFVSLAGDVIIAEPLTVTGSIGVFGGKFVVSDLLNKLDIDIATVKTNDNADMLSVAHKFSNKEKTVFNNSLDEVYRDFTAKVEENRRLKRPIDEVARGRIWLGKQALEIGLVDKLGGYGEAIIEARDLGKIGRGEKFKIVEFPSEKDFGEKLNDFFKSKRKINAQKILYQNVNIPYLKLFKRWQYDTIMLPFEIKM